jgi:uncharacterized iron-regulated protein
MPCRAIGIGAALGAALFVSAGVAGDITPAALAGLPTADIVILGEVHDNPTHHLNQAAAVGAIRPAAVVFEMLDSAQAARAAPELQAFEAELGVALGWEAAGWPDFAMYYPIFAAAGDARIVAGTETVEAARRAVREGAATVFGAGSGYFGLDQALPEAEQAARVEEQRVAHCDALPEDLLPGMVEAQRLRDAWLARAAIEAHAETGGPVVVITGNGHARRDWGVPALLARAAPDLSVLSVGQYEVEAEEAPPYDFWLVTEGVDRPDPCDVFRQ